MSGAQSPLGRHLPDTVGTGNPGWACTVESRKPVSPQVCYLCHSLLTLAGVVVSCQDITPDQWVSLPRGWAGAGGGGAQPTARNWKEWEAEKKAGLGELASSSSQQAFQRDTDPCPRLPIPPLPFLPHC